MMYFADMFLSDPLSIVFTILLCTIIVGAFVMQIIEEGKRQEELNRYYSDIYEAITGKEW